MGGFKYAWGSDVSFLFRMPPSSSFALEKKKCKAKGGRGLTRFMYASIKMRPVIHDSLSPLNDDRAA